MYVWDQKIRKFGIPCKPQFFYIKVWLKGIYIFHGHAFLMFIYIRTLCLLNSISLSRLLLTYVNSKA